MGLTVVKPSALAIASNRRFCGHKSKIEYDGQLEPKHVLIEAYLSEIADESKEDQDDWSKEQPTSNKRLWRFSSN